MYRITPSPMDLSGGSSGSEYFSEEDLDGSTKSTSMLTPFSRSPAQEMQRVVDGYTVPGNLSIPARYRWDIRDFQVENTLGSGSFGCTMLAYRLKPPQVPFALKVQRVRSEGELMDYLDRELSMGLMMTYGARLGATTAAEPYLGKVYAVQLLDHLPAQIQQSVQAGCGKLYQKWLQQSDNTLKGSYVLSWMELTEGVSLSKRIIDMDYATVSLDELRTSLFSVLWSLHGASQEYGFTHNDLNPGNMILSRQQESSFFRVIEASSGDTMAVFRIPHKALVTTIIDYGKSTTLYNEYHMQGSFVGAPAYVTAPEVAAAFLAGRPIERPTIASDVYSVGRGFLMLLTRQVLFKPPSASFESMFLAYMRDNKDFGYKAGVNDTFGQMYYNDLMQALLYAYEYNLVRGDQQGLQPPIPTSILQDTRFGESVSTFQRTAEGYNLSRHVLGHNKKLAYGTTIVKALDLAIAQRAPVGERAAVRDIFNQMLAWDPSDRVGVQDSLDALLAHPFFQPLRINAADIAPDASLYTTTEEGSLYFKQEPALREARLNNADDSGFRINTKIR